MKFKKIVIDYMKKNTVFRKIVRTINLHFKQAKYLRYKFGYKMDDKTVLFEVFGGRSYACSPKAIYEEMLKLDEFKSTLTNNPLIKDKKVIVFTTSLIIIFCMISGLLVLYPIKYKEVIIAVENGYKLKDYIK